MRTGTANDAHLAVPSSPDSRERVNGSLVLPYRWLVNVGALFLGDSTALIAGFAASQLMRWADGRAFSLPPWLLLTIVLWLLGALATRLLPGWGLGIVRELRGIVVLLTMVFAGSITLAYLSRLRVDLQRFDLAVVFLVALVLIPYLRTKVKYLLIRLGAWGVPTIVFGDEAESEAVLAALRQEPGLGYDPVAVCHDFGGSAPADGASGLAGERPPTRRASAAIIAGSAATQEELQRALDGPLAGYRRVLVMPQLAGAPSLWVEARDLGGLLGLEIAQHLADPVSRAVKRGFELVVVVASSPLWAPAVAFLALVCRIVDRHAPFFAQERIGRDGRSFRMWKLRTMRVGAEKELQAQLDQDPGAREEWSNRFKLRDDSRVTPLGQLLRRLSLDELPQLWNVLRGEMSLVGPRPLPAYHHRCVAQPARSLRDGVRPGMTGLWQVSGRSELGLEKLGRSDTYYVRNWSIWLDLVILVRTWRTIISRVGAY